MVEIGKDKQVLIGCIAGSFVVYHTALGIYRYFSTRKQAEEWIPVGTVTGLHIYPIKSGFPIDLFSFKCTEMGPVFRELEDRAFLVVDGDTGKFVTGRQKPNLVLVKSYVENGLLTVEVPDKPKVVVNLEKVVEQGKLIRATLFENLKQDGYDCGDEVGKLLSDYINETNFRLIFFKKGLYTERTCIPDETWWNTPVPKRKDDSGFTDLAPFLVTTDASEEAINERLDETITFRRFRPSIRVGGPEAWDEDKWAEIRVGDAQLEFFAPCTRCVLTTVDPEKGEMNKNVQPLKELRQFRLAPEGKMRGAHKDSPIFGAFAGTKKEGYIHVGQTVYARYKPTAF